MRIFECFMLTFLWPFHLCNLSLKSFCPDRNLKKKIIFFLPISLNLSRAHLEGRMADGNGREKRAFFSQWHSFPRPLASRCLLLAKEKRWQLLSESLRVPASPQRGACSFPACDHLSLNGLIFWLIQLEISLVPWNENKGTVLKMLRKVQNRNHHPKKKKTPGKSSKWNRSIW